MVNDNNSEKNIIGSSSTFAAAGTKCAPSPDATVQVFVSPHATANEINAVRAGIETIPGVTIDRYLDPDAAYAQFACVFNDNPDLLNSTQPADLSVSFAVKTGPIDRETLDRLRGVLFKILDVETPASWSTSVATSIDDPNGIWHMMLRT